MKEDRSNVKKILSKTRVNYEKNERNFVGF